MRKCNKEMQQTRSQVTSKFCSCGEKVFSTASCEIKFGSGLGTTLEMQVTQLLIHYAIPEHSTAVSRPCPDNLAPKWLNIKVKVHNSYTHAQTKPHPRSTTGVKLGVACNGCTLRLGVDAVPTFLAANFAPSLFRLACQTLTQSLARETNLSTAVLNLLGGSQSGGSLTPNPSTY